MPRRLLSDEDPDDPEESTGHETADLKIPPPIEAEDVAVPPEPVAPSGLLPKQQLLLRTNYSCQCCWVQLRNRPDLLHHHHPGQDKTTDDPRYTRLACLVCHQKSENHEFMSSKYSRSDFDYVAEMRRTQNRACHHGK